MDLTAFTHSLTATLIITTTLAATLGMPTELPQYFLHGLHEE